ncbi:protein disulfide-isomerase-like protein of the testis [Gracilinanus agilis]|uniref:protein disulfide-isomerase-like protein of the testis n=1 Tax=Gracilinanus agilis TaxID=191870 RepID=UPI001CFE3BC0|nr:protein disulfide-isomerase-like protein of the testis [Gracilinanus agilis]
MIILIEYKCLSDVDKVVTVTIRPKETRNSLSQQMFETLDEKEIQNSSGWTPEPSFDKGADFISFSRRRKMLLLWVTLLLSSCLSGARAWGGWDFQNDRIRKLEALGIQEEKNLLVLTATTLAKVLNETRFLMVEFYNPLSKQSQNLIKEMGKAVDIMGKENPGVLFGKVNITSEKLLKQEFAIKDVPTVKLFVEGHRQWPIDCRGVIEAAALVTWLRNQIRQSIVLLTNREQTKAFINSRKLIVIGFFEDLHEGTVELFYELVKDFPEVPFGMIEKRDLWIRYGITIDTMVVFQQGKIVHFEECEEDSHILRDLSKIVKFFTMDLVIEYNIETMDQIYDMHIRNHILLFISKNSTEFGALVKIFELAALEFKNKLIFLIVNTDEIHNIHVLEYFQIASWDIPSVRILNLTKSMKYQMPADEITFKNLKNFCKDFLDGLAKVVPYDGEYTLDAFINFVEKEIKSQMESEEWSFEQEEPDEKEDLSVQDWGKIKEEL